MVKKMIMSLKETIIEMKKEAQSALLGLGERDFNLEKQNLMDRRKILFIQAKIFFQRHTAHIEVLREDKNIEKTYFYLPPFCLHLDDENKTKFNQEANRASIKSKVTSLQQSAQDIIKVMKLNF